MADLTPKDRLQPSLFDRLTDDEPDKQQEGCDKRVLSMRGLRRAVLRDLGWLFNSAHLALLQDLSSFPLAARSVINYGGPDFSGKTASGLDVTELAYVLRDMIWTFEPRILRDSLEVNALVNQKDIRHPNEIDFEVHGQLWGQPLPEQLYLRTEVDLDVGEIRLFDTDVRAA
jgi:type VI secretion system protein ImpF